VTKMILIQLKQTLTTVTMFFLKTLYRVKIP